MKKLWAFVAIIAIAGGLFLLLRNRNPSPENSTARDEAVSSNPATPLATQAKSQTAPLAAPGASAPNAAAPDALAFRAASPNPVTANGNATNALPDLPPLTVQDKTRVVIHNYRDAFGENPVGTNPEITAALRGKNPKQTDFLGDSGLRVNGNGELLDGYGTPVFFHQISGKEMEIRSAGQDHILWTADDLVTK
jgi:hypothetical protein